MDGSALGHSAADVRLFDSDVTGGLEQQRLQMERANDVDGSQRFALICTAHPWTETPLFITRALHVQCLPYVLVNQF